MSYTDGAGRFGQGVWTGTAVARGTEQAVQRPSTLTIAVAPPKPSERQRFVVEKSQELGVSRLVWLKTGLSQGRPPLLTRAAAWQVAALEQSRGAWLTDLGGPVTVGELSDPIMCDTTGEPFEQLDVSQPLTIAIGPEGGWSVSDLASLERKVSIAPTVLRTETAVVVAAALIMHGV